MNDPDLTHLLGTLTQELSSIGRPATHLLDAAHRANRRRAVRNRAVGTAGLLAVTGAGAVALARTPRTSSPATIEATSGSAPTLMASSIPTLTGPPILHVNYIVTRDDGVVIDRNDTYEDGTAYVNYVAALNGQPGSARGPVDGEDIVVSGSNYYDLGPAGTMSYPFETPASVRDGIASRLLTEQTPSPAGMRTFTVADGGTLVTDQGLQTLSETSAAKSDGKGSEHFTATYELLPRTDANVAKTRLQIPSGAIKGDPATMTAPIG